MPERLRWRLRDYYFHGPGEYVFDLGGEKLPLQVDANGYFETADRPAPPFGVFAKQVVGETTI